jgi:hypothetical protein
MIKYVNYSPMKRLFFLIAVLSLLSTAHTYAQCVPTTASEDKDINGLPRIIGCNNGVDDDCDGFVDCFDSDCADETVCDGSYVGNDAGCTPPKTVKPKFTMTLDFQTADETANHLGRVVVGDLDRDGIPEMVTTNKFSKRIMIINGATGAVKKDVFPSFAPSYEEIAIANLDNDNCAEIFVIDGSWNLYSFDCNLTQLWKVKLPGDPGMIGIADFGGDGKSEIYVRDAIYDASTGVEIVQSQASLAGNWDKINGGPVAADMNEDGKLDLVDGCTIYDVDLGARTFHSGSLKIQKYPDNTDKTLAQYFIRHTLNATSVADFDLDGSLDVIASGSTIGNGKNTTIFYWNPAQKTYYTYFDSSPTAYLPNGWGNGTGRVNIADLDGDGALDLSYVSGKFLYALAWNKTLLQLEPIKTWVGGPKVVNEETSGYTGCTLFDFNGDGQSEIVYRDEKNLYIINGVDGSIYSQQTCVSRTNREYPIVADVDADGSTEICVTCRTVDFYPGTDAATGLTNDYIDFNNINRSQYSQVRVFKSAAEPWVPARRVWNQHGYFNVNVNDNLTIPTHQQLHHKKFSTSACYAGDPPVEHRPLNSFLNQSPYIDVKGCPQFSAPNIVFDGGINVTQPTCPDTDFTITFTIKNIGDLPLTGNFPITFYNGDPMVSGSKKLNTFKVMIPNLKKGDTKTINPTIEGDGSAFKLYIVLNDLGTSNPIITLPNSNIIDCPDDNITSVDVNPGPAQLDVSSTANQQCPFSTSPANGSASASVPGWPTGDFNYFWSDGPVVNNPVDRGLTYSGLVAGDYTVYAVSKTANCSSVTQTVTVGSNTPPDPTIDVTSTPFTDCKKPNASAEVSMNGTSGTDPNKYTIQWWTSDEANLIGKELGLSSKINGLKSAPYIVKVTDKLTGCNTSAPVTPVDQTPKFTVSLTHTDTNCSNVATGTVSVNSLIVTSPAGYLLSPSYAWYNGNSVKPGPSEYLPAGATIGPVGAGNYTIQVTDTNSNCISAPATETVIQTLPPTFTANPTAQNQFSCNPSSPTGAAIANVDDPTKYDYQWFSGQGIGNPMTDSIKISISHLVKGFYTIQITDKITKCTDTREVKIIDAIQTFAPTPFPTGNSSCSTSTGSISVDGLPKADSFYNFFLDDGVNPPIKQVHQRLFQNVVAGTYTVWATDTDTDCESDNKQVTVINNQPIIKIKQNVIDNTDCSKTDGNITVDILSTNINGYAINWSAGGVAPGDPLPGTAVIINTPVINPIQSELTSIAFGLYTVSIKDNDSQCVLDTAIYIGFKNGPKFTNPKHTDVINCDLPSIGGSIYAELKTPGFTNADYDVYWYAAVKDPNTIVGGTLMTSSGVVTPPDVYGYPSSVVDVIDPVFYTMVAIPKPSTGFPPECKASITIKVNKVVSFPIVNKTVAPNSYCNTTLGADGLIHLLLGAAKADPPINYSFSWTDSNNNPLAGSGVNGEDLQNLKPGSYTVDVAYTTPVNKGCSTQKTILVGDSPETLDVPNITASVANCDPLNGFNPGTTPVTLPNVNVDGTNHPLPDAPDFTMDWYNSDGSNLSLKSTSNTVASVLPGDYFVIVEDGPKACIQTKSFKVDNLIDKVGVDLKDFRNELFCIDPRKGMLRAIGTRASGTTGNFDYEWYDPTPTLISSLDSAANLSQNTAYKVIAKDQISFCWATDTYTLSSDKVPVVLIANSSPLTNCTDSDVGTTDDNASLIATVIVPPNVPPGFTNIITQTNFTFVWMINGVQPTSGKFATSLNTISNVSKSDLDLGPITVMAIDKGNPANCFSDPPTPVTVDSTRTYPNVSATPFSGVTVCNADIDPTKADGVAKADVNGNQIDYIFKWAEGQPRPLPLANPALFTGPIVNHLQEKLYTVQATDKITGCKGYTTVTIEPDHKPVAFVGLQILSNVTTCDPLPPNGSIKAVVDRPIDYTFEWSKDGVLQSETTDTFNGLEANVTYSVLVTNKNTKCTATGQTKLKEEHVIPDFDFTVHPSTCDKNDGAIALFLKNTEAIDIDSIWWDVTPIQTGPILSGISSGTYTAHVVTLLGCQHELSVTVGTDIHPYNGISTTSTPGQNDYFHIDCISNFPDNQVKIYNRAGTLVYEAEHYNNIDIMFDGKSNKGVSLMGTNLPDGTYFYVIDKRDGSKRKAGYLEIVN